MKDKRHELLKAAREHFYKKGFKQTSVAEVAQGAGIAVGSFYKFFNSKEELFSRIFVRENEQLKQKLFESVDAHDDPVAMVIKLVAENADRMNKNPILREWYNPNLMAKLETYFQRESGVKSIEDMANAGMKDMIAQWQNENKIRRDLDQGMILSMFRSIPYIDLHKSEIGPEYFPQVLIRIVEFIMKGLIPENR